MMILIPLLLMIFSLTWVFFLRQGLLKQQVILDGLMKTYAPVEELKSEFGKLEENYKKLQQVYSSTRGELLESEDIIARYETGVGTIDTISYQPLFENSDLSFLESEINKNKQAVKDCVRQKKACVSHLRDVAVNGRKSGGTNMVNREIKLRIRILDNEVKGALAIMEWNNINRLVDRVRATFDSVNNDSKLMQIFLEKEYLDLKTRELRLSYEINRLKFELKEDAREERSRLREEARDEERIKAALKKTESDRVRMEALVARELERLDGATKEQKSKLELHQKELGLLKEREARAVSMAQQTRAGFVYIISNEGSFGPGVTKIGMTRRLDPNDRVKELGDASVPNLFTVHSFIYTDDAPSLEKYFHDVFDSERVNMVNRRKEFFRVDPKKALTALDSYSGEYRVGGI